MMCQLVKGGGLSVMAALPMPLSEAGNLDPFSPFRAVFPRLSLTTRTSPTQELATTGRMRQASTPSSPGTYAILTVGSTPPLSHCNRLEPLARRGEILLSHPGA